MAVYPSCVCPCPPTSSVGKRWWCRGGGGAFGSCQINQVPAGDRIKANRLCWGADIRWRDDSYVSGCEKRRGSDRDSNAFSSGARAPPVTVDVNIDQVYNRLLSPILRYSLISLSNGSAMVTVALPRRASVSDRPRQRCAEAGGNMCGPGSYGDSSLTLSRIGSIPGCLYYSNYYSRPRSPTRACRSTPKQWQHSGITVASQWHRSGIAVVTQW